MSRQQPYHFTQSLILHLIFLNLILPYRLSLDSLLWYLSFLHSLFTTQKCLYTIEVHYLTTLLIANIMLHQRQIDEWEWVISGMTLIQED